MFTVFTTSAIYEFASYAATLLFITTTTLSVVAIKKGNNEN